MATPKRSVSVTVKAIDRALLDDPAIRAAVEAKQMAQWSDTLNVWKQHHRHWHVALYASGVTLHECIASDTPIDGVEAMRRGRAQAAVAIRDDMYLVDGGHITPQPESHST